MDIGLLILRAVLGLYLFGHGTQKLFGWFGGSGLAATAKGMERTGFRPGLFAALASGGAEAGGAVLLALGLLSPLGALGIAATMVVAGATHWSKGVWARNGGFELPLTNLAAALALALTGPGRFSLDAALKIALPEPVTGIVVTALAIVGVGAMLVSRGLMLAAQKQQTRAA